MTTAQDIDDNNDAVLQQFKQHIYRSDAFAYEQLIKLEGIILKKSTNYDYLGQFRNKKKHGKGILIYKNERKYEGEFQNDNKHGYGYEIFPQGANYEGEYQNSKAHGKGCFRWSNGETYDGEWVQGIKHGYGLWTSQKGDSYQGQWKEGIAHGQGKHTWHNGDQYEGGFEECLKHGEGREDFANGDFYQGTYIRGKPNGYGEYNWSNGSVFKGYFSLGLRSGKGLWRKIYDDGTLDQYCGYYENDKKNGYGEYSWANGNLYKGEFVDDFKHGSGVMYFNDGTIFKGNWVGGKMIQQEIQLNEQSKRLPSQEKEIQSISNENRTPNLNRLKIKSYAQQKNHPSKPPSQESNATNRLDLNRTINRVSHRAGTFRADNNYERNTQKSSVTRKIEPTNYNFERTTQQGFRLYAQSSSNDQRRQQQTRDRRLNISGQQFNRPQIKSQIPKLQNTGEYVQRTNLKQQKII